MNRQQTRTLWFLYLSLMSSVVLYAVVAVLIDGQGGPKNLEQGGLDLATLQIVFLALGVGATVMSFVIPGLVVRAPRGEALPYQSLVTKKILQWAFSETIAIFGLVLYFLSGELNLVYVFAAWAAVVMVFHGPFGLDSSDRRS